MKAVLLTGAGGADTLQLMEVPDPALKGLQDVLVRLHASGLIQLTINYAAGVVFTPIACRSFWAVMGLE